MSATVPLERTIQRSTLKGRIIIFPPPQGFYPVQSTKSENTPIKLVPPEILSRIFFACTCQTLSSPEITFHEAYHGYSFPTHRDGGDSDEFRSDSYLPWIAITRVCRHWRSVALACPELWRVLIFSSRKATKNMIRLSKGAALILKAGHPNWFYDEEKYGLENVRMAIAELQRVSVLRLRFPTNLLQSLVDRLLAAAPRLQSLRLGTQEDKIGVVSYPPFTLPEAIFNQCTPSLRLLQLIHCKFVWNSLPLRGLTHLDLRRPAIPPRIAQILSFLRETPILETLILDRAISRDSIHARTTSSRLFLPHIHHLTLDDSVDHCADLLENLTYSATTLVSIHCEMPSSDTVDRVIHAIQSAAAYGEGDFVIHALGLSLIRSSSDYLEEEKNRCILSCGVIVRHSTPLQDSVQLIFTLSAPSTNRHFLTPALRAAGAAICLTDVQTFYVGISLLRPDHEYEADWLFFIRLLPNVHTIHFGLHVPISFVQLLANNGMEETINAPTMSLLPRLRSLWLTRIEFEGCREALLTFFQSRLRFGVAIEHIYLRDSWDLTEDVVTQFREFVGDVDWDGIGRYNDGYSCWTDSDSHTGSTDAGFDSDSD